MNFASARVNNKNKSFSLNKNSYYRIKLFCNGNCKVCKSKSLYMLLTKIQETGHCMSHNMNPVHIIISTCSVFRHAQFLLCLFTFQKPISSTNIYSKSYYVLQGYNFSHKVLFWELL